MSFSIPSFIKKSNKNVSKKEQVDVDLEEETPLSTFKTNLTSVEKSIPSRKRSPQKTSGSRSSKRLRGDLGRSPSDVTTFLDSIKERTPQPSIREWDKISMEEAVDTISLANTQSLFLHLKFGREIAEAAKGDLKVREELVGLR
ncbi:hypothetical protein POM88_022982 [Heracleum sosnowskyi]|uniref:Uncharacterized protein n=1 Tax=Heracleum sosnowskyi TaxID=360622 RepID=A0AAD8MUE2_9APIA|nr:hypothetical protein POM88_022982 [Heracleum sosnowskyi]